MIPIVFWASLVPWPRLYAAAETSCSRRKSQSTRPGWVSLKIHTVASIIAKPTVSPITGASTMKTPILIRPAPMSDPNPALATAAPANPPINACDELVGNPQYHVIRSQTMAPTSPARIIHWSTTFDSTTPLPTVLATCTPKPKAATKLKKAAHTTACSGVSTRVETTVAMELAASWNPLMKSKMRATRTMQAMSVNTSGHLQNDPFDHVSHVLAAVGDDLHRLVDLLPLDDLDGIARRLEHRGQAVAEEIVGAVLETVHLDGVLVEPRVHRAQASNRPVGRLDDPHDDLGHGPARRGRLLDPVHHQTLGRRLDVVEHVVEPRRQIVDVLPVDRRDERGVQPLDDLVGDLVSLVLDFLDGVRLGPRIGEVVDQLVEQRRPLDHVLRLLLEQVEKADFPRDQAEHGRATQSVTETECLCQRWRTRLMACAGRERERRGSAAGPSSILRPARRRTPAHRPRAGARRRPGVAGPPRPPSLRPPRPQWWRHGRTRRRGRPR